MISAPPPSNEAARLASLYELEVLDTEFERAYDELTALAAAICGTPIALVSLVDADRQWFKSRHGLGAAETPRALAFCAHAILGDDVFEVQDAHQDPRFQGNPLVDGAPNVVFYAGVPLRGPDQLALGTLCVIDDHARSLRPDQRAALRALGNQVVGQLELRRTNLRLQRALQAAEDANRAKGDFLARMSHEIRTPLNGVIGLADLLCTAPLDAKEAAWAHQLRSSGKLLLSVVNDVLDLSRLEAEALPLDPQPTDVGAVLRDCVGLFGPTARAKGLELRLAGPPSPPAAVRIDGARLQQVVNNLVSNAIKFTAAGQVTVRWSWAEGRVTLLISDTGRGVPKDLQSAIFDPFRQTQAADAQAHGGAGLGLAIVRRLCLAMGGAVTCEDELGGGARFVVELAAPLTAAPRPAAPLNAPLSPRRVLVAEDNLVNQAVARGMLEALGHTVEVVEDGAAAVTEVAAARGRGTPYDIVLMDMWMPQLDGLEATRRILAEDRGVPVLGFTANADPESARACLAAGMRGVLTKPLTLGRLREGLDAAARAG